jgi:hypothetical protein
MTVDPSVAPGNAGRDDYPRMLYHPDGRTLVVDTPAQEDPLLHEGWVGKPLPVHLRPKSTPSMVFGSNDPLAVIFRAVLEQVLDERGVGRSPGVVEPVPHLPLRHHKAKE